MDGELVDIIPPDLRACVDDAINTAREIAAESERIESVAIIRNLEESVIFPFDHIGNSGFAATLIRKVAAQMDATSIIIVAEAWMARDTTGEERQKYQKVHDMPNRRDIVFFHVETESGIWFADADIASYNPDVKQAREFGPPFFHFTETTGGFFASLLPRGKQLKH